MAPEQITNGPLTPATDLFAVGCLLYELLSYRKPVEGETVRGVLYQVLTTDPKPVLVLAPSLPLALGRVVAKALNKVPEDRYETARHMQSALSGIRAALSGASEPTARLAARWTPLPDAALRLVTHMSLKWRAAVLTALMVTALVLLYVSRSPSPVAAPLSTDATATLDQLLAYPLPTGLNGALTAQRDSALAAQPAASRPAGGHRGAAPGSRARRLERARREPARPHARYGGTGRGGLGAVLPAVHAPHGAVCGRGDHAARRRGARHGADALHLCAGAGRRPERKPLAPDDPLHQDARRLAGRRHPRPALAVSPRRARSRAAAAGWP